MADEKPQRQQLLFTMQEAAPDLGVSISLLKRAASHGRIKLVPMGDRPMMPLEEKQRIAREGLGNLPPGYKRKTTGPAKGGRPSKVAKTMKTDTNPVPRKAVPVPPKRRRKADQGERATT